MSKLREKIQKAVKGIKGEGLKKQISVMVDERLIQQMDIIADQFKILTGGNGGDLPTSRNQLIESAINEYVEEAINVLLSEKGTNVEELMPSSKDEEPEPILEELSSEDILVVFPGHQSGFNEVFIDEKKWYAISIAEQNRKKIKYVACYITSPCHLITHYAIVDEILPFENTSKCVITFKGEPIKLKKSVGRGNQRRARQGIKYTTLTKLQHANDIWDL